MQKLAKRMTRFCVVVSVHDAVSSIAKICSSSGFRVKTPLPQQVNFLLIILNIFNNNIDFCCFSWNR